MNLKAKSVLAALVALVVSGASDPSAAADSKPMNVLFLAVDDLNTWLLENPDRYTGRVIAPNMKRLAESGVNFVRNFSPCPVCSPCRTALMSGVAPWKSGVYNNSMEHSASEALRGVDTLPIHLKKNGYYISSYGKIFHGYRIKSGWDNHIPHTRSPRPPNAPLNGFSRGDDFGPYHLPESELHDTQYADAAVADLQRDHDRPFFIACGIFRPHSPLYAPQKYFDMYPLDEVELPPINEDDVDDIPEAGRKLIFFDKDAKYKRVGVVKKYIQAYLACTTFADAQIGRVLDALEESPYRDNTLVVLWSDHGFHLGEKQHWSKRTMWEEATNSLLMFRVPGVTQPEQVCSRPVTLLDIYPTILDLLGVEPPTHLDGRSIRPLLENPDALWPHPALSTFERHMCVVTERYRFIRYEDNTTELYDRASDPHEWVNQTDAPELAEVKATLAAALPPLSEMAPRVPYQGKKRGEK